MTDAEVLRLLASHGGDFARGLVELGWFRHAPTLSHEEYRSDARSATHPKFDTAGKVAGTEASVLRLTLQDGTWQDAIAIFESHLRRSPQFAVCFCRVSAGGLLIMTPADPDKSGRKSPGLTTARVYLDIAHPGVYEGEMLRKLREAPRGRFAKALQDAISVEKVTKKFYDEFKKQKEAFIGEITGIGSEADRKWYASVLLNRLMFIYFIQAGSMMPEPDYLARHLRNSKGRYYRDFLLPLFFDGLGSPEPRPDEVTQKLGNVPYLNGGLFQRHELEARYPDLNVPDAAFGAVFEFFDAYTWHIDDRPMRTDRQINPDVLGYIFEKYVNQKQMGAYYTKEDITEYISKNTIIPFLFERVLERCPIESADWQPWEMLKQWPQDYIYPAVKKGVLDEDGTPLPEDLLPEWVREDMASPRARMYDRRYNLGAAEYVDAAGREYHLPTETWREYAERRARCLENHGKLSRGEVTDVNDFITLNLNIRRFAEDAISICDDPDVLLAWYGALTSLSVLDPTCGSGAFLFAAVSILEPLYRACLRRMENLNGERKEFAGILREAEGHPSRRYFILKTIILNNLYGVDIEEEAVEICKLRLFLKLAGHAEPDAARPNYGIEPLPDIDFSIRAGNTLVGYATEEQARSAFDARTGQGRLDLNDDWGTFVGRLSAMDSTTQAFRSLQMDTRTAYNAPAAAALKNARRKELEELAQLADYSLAREYGINPTNVLGDFSGWKKSHQPFHWFIEFHEIMKRGGFDVVIGNPPYVAYADVRRDYTVRHFKTMAAANLYAYAAERGFTLLAQHGRFGFIVPLSLTFSEDLSSTREFLLAQGAHWLSSYDNIPAALFTGVSQRCTVVLTRRGTTDGLRVTPLWRWRAEHRPNLLPCVAYSACERDAALADGVPRFPNAAVARVMLTMRGQVAAAGGSIVAGQSTTGASLRYSPTARNFISVFLADPPCVAADTHSLLAPSDAGRVSFSTASGAAAALAASTGELCYTHWLVHGDGFHVTSGVLVRFLLALNPLPANMGAQLAALGALLHARRFEALVFKKNAGRYVGNFNWRRHTFITRRADLLVMAALGLDATSAIAVFDHVQRVLGINESAGEKGIPPSIKALFPAAEADREREAEVFAAVDKVITDYYGLTQADLSGIVGTEQDALVATDNHANDAGDGAEE